MNQQEWVTVTEPEEAHGPAPTGLVVRTGPGSYLVRSGDAVWNCRLRGRLKAKRQKLSDMSVVVGDYVELDKLDPKSGTALISEILPRRTSLYRLAPPPWPGTTLIPQVLAVNVDFVVAVAAAVAPPLKLTTIDRYLLLARQAQIAPAVCINKVDQAGIDLEIGSGLHGDGGLDARHVLEVKRALEDRGVKVLLTSAATGQGLEELRSLLQGKTSVFAGPSGVGKTSLLKGICPDLQAKTLSISSTTGKGRHSTTFSSLIDIGGGYVADLPGLRAIGFWNLSEDTVKSEFEDIDEIAAGCRFSDCSHTHEPGCAVKAALHSGELDEDRYQEYMRVMKDAMGKSRRRSGP
ncbi:MAG: ribosome small subunit-dependent GTPase A [Bacillota bacterium]